MSPLLIASLLVAIVALAWWWHYHRGWETIGPAAIWDPSPSGASDCPNTLVKGFCILPSADEARKACAADPACLGYLVPDPKIAAGWGLPVGSTQLVRVPPQAATAAWSAQTMYYKKRT